MTTKILAVYLFFDGAMLEIYYGSKLSVMTGRFDLQSGAATRKVLHKSCCCEFCEISKKTFFQRTRPKAASAAKLLHTNEVTNLQYPNSLRQNKSNFKFDTAFIENHRSLELRSKLKYLKTKKDIFVNCDCRL